ncbi:MAG: hypothetical protein QW532_00045 [Archaeoglobaceae archaeon]
MEEIKRIESCEDLLLATKDFDHSYPIFVAPDRTVSIKKKPAEVQATFFVKEFKEQKERLEHPLLQKVLEVLKEIHGKEPYLRFGCISFEFYYGDLEKFIGEAMGYLILVECSEYASKNEKQAWAVGFERKKRVIAKAPELQKYVFVRGMPKDRGYYATWLRIRLPVTNERLETLVQNAFKVTKESFVDIAAEIEKTKKLIKEKEIELEFLKKRLAELEMCMQLEKMKNEMCRDQYN